VSPPVATRLGVVTGYRGEASCLADPHLEVRCSGADAGRARTLARQLAAEGVHGLVSFGLAGALSADLAPGDLLLPDAVVLPGGGRVHADRGWRERLTAFLQEQGVSAHGAPIAGSDEIVASVEAKQALAACSGAAAVDMESHAVAASAAQAGLPFLMLRAIADSSTQSVPSAVQGTIDPQGGIRHAVLLARLLARPWQIRFLITLGRGSAQGLATLRRVAALAPGLGFA